MNKMIIVRGLPGSGKSYLVNKEYGNNPDAHIFSTDDLWYSKGINPEYFWVPSAVKIAHELNQYKVREACLLQIPIVIVDNTNITKKDIAPYLKIAEDCLYKVEILQPNNSWSFDIEECFKRNVHEVPKEIIEKMKNKWEDNV